MESLSPVASRGGERDTGNEYEYEFSEVERKRRTPENEGYLGVEEDFRSLRHGEMVHYVPCRRGVPTEQFVSSSTLRPQTDDSISVP